MGYAGPDARAPRVLTVEFLVGRSRYPDQGRRPSAAVFREVVDEAGPATALLALFLGVEVDPGHPPPELAFHRLNGSGGAVPGVVSVPHPVEERAGPALRQLGSHGPAG